MHAFNIVARSLVAIGLSLVGCCSVLAQASGAFAAASIKVLGPNGQKTRAQIDPAGIHVSGVSLRWLICTAYHADDYQLIGGDSWTSDPVFVIDAATGRAASNEEIMAMLRKLISDRFALDLSAETKSEPVFDLVESKSGPKFKPLGVGEKPLPPINDPPGTKSMSVGTSMRGLLNFLNLIVGQKNLGYRVIDKTNITGNFNLWLTLPADVFPDHIYPHLDNIPAVLHEQLGLDLRRDVADITYYTIRSASRPKPN